ncbi:MAG: 5'/3'-nucleotidase SurE [Flavobacteriales bacterium]
MTAQKPLILVVNDDGISAKGIRALLEVAKPFGEIYVVAPDSPQSGMGHAITINSFLRLDPQDFENGVEHEYACSGTPADCVKIAIQQLLPRRPDLVISGINHGSNESCNVIYSGTMSAAVEAAIEGIPAIGFSLLDYSAHADFSYSQDVAKRVITEVLSKGLPKDICLNVNIPKGKKEELKGIRICRQARGNWKESFDHRQDPAGKDYYWLTGSFINYDAEEAHADSTALADGFVSVVPIQFDLTAHKAINELKTWNL